MIDRLVAERPGGFEQMNAYLTQAGVDGVDGRSELVGVWVCQGLGVILYGDQDS